MSIRKTKSEELSELLEGELRSRNLPAGTALPSLRHLAQHYGVSMVTAVRMVDLMVERGFAYKVPRRGSFICKDPPRKPMIGYAGSVHTISLAQEDVLMSVALRRLRQFFASKGISPRLVSYPDLCDPVAGRGCLAGLDGLLISSTHIDDLTYPVLSGFKGRLMVIGEAMDQGKLLASLVVPDYLPAMMALSYRFPLQEFSGIYLFSSDYGRSRQMMGVVREFLRHQGVQPDRLHDVSLAFTSLQLYSLGTCHYVREHLPGLTGSHLVLACSDYMALGILEAFRDSASGPVIVGCDNLMDYMEASELVSGLTSIDWRMPEIYEEGARRLIDLIERDDPNNYVVKIPSCLVVRDS